MLNLGCQSYIKKKNHEKSKNYLQKGEIDLQMGELNPIVIQIYECLIHLQYHFNCC